MNNYEYIIASLPSPGVESFDAGAMLDFIRSQCSGQDSALIDMILDGFDGDKLSNEFYHKAIKSHSSFVRDFLGYDLKLRNTKVEYLNKALERQEGTDIIHLSEDEDPDFDEKPAMLSVLEQDDILARERGLDDLLWNKADELTRMHLFDMDVILAFVAKLKITDRWNKLDPATGREMFRYLIQEIRNTR